MFGLTSTDLDIIVDYLKKYPQIEQALIFGSRAKGNHQKGSDIDIALKGENIDPILPRLAGELNDESPLPFQFDILNYHALSNTNLKDHIDRIGKVIYCSQK